MSLEALLKYLGKLNLFMTLNMDPRAWPDVRELVYQMEYRSDKEIDKICLFAV